MLLMVEYFPILTGKSKQTFLEPQYIIRQIKIGTCHFLNSLTSPRDSDITCNLVPLSKIQFLYKTGHGNSIYLNCK